MDRETKSRLRELMFFVVPDPDEIIDDDVLERSESVDYEESQRMKSEFRLLIETLDDWPDIRRTVLTALDDMDDSSHEATGNDVEWMNVRDVMGRRIHRVLAPLIAQS